MTTASPSSGFSPVASKMAEPCVTSTVLVPPRGRAASIRRSPLRRPSRAFAKNSGDSRAREARTRPNARRAVSRVRQKGLASTRLTGIPSRRKARPIARDWRRPSAFRLRCREQSVRSLVVSIPGSVAACRNTTACPPPRSRSTSCALAGPLRPSPVPPPSSSPEPRSQPPAPTRVATTSHGSDHLLTRRRLRHGRPRARGQTPHPGGGV